MFRPVLYFLCITLMDTQDRYADDTERSMNVLPVSLSRDIIFPFQPISLNPNPANVENMVSA